MGESDSIKATHASAYWPTNQATVSISYCTTVCAAIARAHGTSLLAAVRPTIQSTCTSTY